MNKSANEILIVEDSKMFGHTIKTKIEADLGLKTHLATSCQEALACFRQRGDDLFAAVLDLVLPDAPQGEVVNYAIERNIPAIVLTGEFSDAVRDEMTAKNIVDYILKEGPHSLDQLIYTLRRLHVNRSTKVLIVEDSKVSRQTIRHLLERHLFEIIEAANGKEALNLLKSHPDTRVVVTDYNMPEMDGFTLIAELRRTYPMDQMVIIGISASGGSLMSAKFLKKGANDFIVKPFSNEEFFLRINQNVQMLDYIVSIRETAIKDHLTGLYNRRYFFDMGAKLFGNANRKHFDLVTAMIDIDYFKKVNDQYGHAVGDKVLRHVSAIMANHFRSTDVVARLGGEEFCVIAPNMSPDHSYRLFDALRERIQSNPLTVKAGRITSTVSIGLAPHRRNTLEETLNHTDRLLYQAKHQGRNQVVVG